MAGEAKPGDPLGDLDAAVVIDKKISIPGELCHLRVLPALIVDLHRILLPVVKDKISIVAVVVSDVCKIVDLPRLHLDISRGEPVGIRGIDLISVTVQIHVSIVIAGIVPDILAAGVPLHVHQGMGDVLKHQLAVDAVPGHKGILQQRLVPVQVPPCAVPADCARVQLHDIFILKLQLLEADALQITVLIAVLLGRIVHRTVEGIHTGNIGPHASSYNGPVHVMESDADELHIIGGQQDVVVGHIGHLFQRGKAQPAVEIAAAGDIVIFSALEARGLDIELIGGHGLQRPVLPEQHKGGGGGLIREEIPRRALSQRIILPLHGSGKVLVLQHQLRKITVLQSRDPVLPEDILRIQLESAGLRRALAADPDLLHPLFGDGPLQNRLPGRRILHLQGQGIHIVLHQVGIGGGHVDPEAHLLGRGALIFRALRQHMGGRQVVGHAAIAAKADGCEALASHLLVPVIRAVVIQGIASRNTDNVGLARCQPIEPVGLQLSIQSSLPQAHLGHSVLFVPAVLLILRQEGNGVLPLRVRLVVNPDNIAVPKSRRGFIRVGQLNVVRDPVDIFPSVAGEAGLTHAHHRAHPGSPRAPCRLRIAVQLLAAVQAAVCLRIHSVGLVAGGDPGKGVAKDILQPYRVLIDGIRGQRHLPGLGGPVLSLVGLLPVEKVLAGLRQSDGKLKGSSLSLPLRTPGLDLDGSDLIQHIGVGAADGQVKDLHLVGQQRLIGIGLCKVDINIVHIA